MTSDIVTTARKAETSLETTLTKAQALRVNAEAPATNLAAMVVDLEQSAMVCRAAVDDALAELKHLTNQRHRDELFRQQQQAHQLQRQLGG